MKDLVVVLTKLERCVVVVRGVPDGVKDNDPRLLERAMQVQGKDWETDDIEIESVATVGPECDEAEIQFERVAAADE